MSTNTKIIRILVEQDTIVSKFLDGHTMHDLASAFDVDVAVIEAIVRNAFRVNKWK